MRGMTRIAGVRLQLWEQMGGEKWAGDRWFRLEKVAEGRRAGSGAGRRWRQEEEDWIQSNAGAKF
ncbi:hypothetical protein EJB05_10652, partial [Eragrostis curvula]